MRMTAQQGAAVFKGKVKSLNIACRTNRSVRLMLRKPGPDQKVSVTPTFGQHWRLGLDNPIAGKYYARVEKRAEGTAGTIYVCRPDAGGKPAWTLKAPEAELFDEQGKLIGKHFGGPTWQLNDGSQITGKMVAKVDAPDTKAIQWLLVVVTSNSGKGALSRVTSIQRVNTVAGLAPESLPPAAAECTESSGEVEVKSSYSADYYFYAQESKPCHG